MQELDLEEILVNQESATCGLYSTGPVSIFAINESHSDMVKFCQRDYAGNGGV